MSGKPMCWSWYERAGSYRPWQARADDCTCDMNVHAPDSQHATACPVNPASRELIARLTGPGDAER